MRNRKRPAWLIALLAGTLAVLVLAVWLGARSSAVRVPASVPEVAYEDFEQLSAPIELPAPAPRPPAPEATGPERMRSGIVLLIDDVGYDLSALRRLLALDLPMAVAVLPEAPHARKAAEMAHAAGRPVLLHLPMEPANPEYRAKMDASFLTSAMDEREIRTRIERLLARIPFVEGVNNHMGSLLTASETHMRWVMDAIRDHGLFFIDSRTAAGSVAAHEARLHGLRWGVRRIFLDHRQDRASIEKAWAAARRCAARGEPCIVIGHPHPETLAFLESGLSGRDRRLLLPLQAALHPGLVVQAAAGGRGT